MASAAHAVRNAVDEHTALDAVAPTDGGWLAQLALTFVRTGSRTQLARRVHRGPLVVQKALYPEGDAVCQCIIVHPPGGIAGGDRIELQADVGPGAHVQLTTPGAAKWYRADGRRALQSVTFRVAGDAILEWCPQGTIVFDGADATSALRVELHGNARFIGWDTVCLGRTASAEQFTHGRWRQRVDVVGDDALLWGERVVLDGGSKLLSSPVGLNGAPVFGTFVAMPIECNAEMLGACRTIEPVEGDGVVTCVGRGLVARYRGPSSESAHAYFAALWTELRPRMTGRSAVVPRIWRT
jgi:urease accessory protein